MRLLTTNRDPCMVEVSVLLSGPFRVAVLLDTSAVLLKNCT